MAQLRFIGNRPMEVVCNGHPRGGRLGLVEPDQLFEVPDEVFLAHSWPETLWSEVEVPEREKPEEAEFAPGDGLALSQEGEAPRFQPGDPEPEPTADEKPSEPEKSTTEDEPAPSAFGRKSRTASEKE